jgi:hypothetical protein
MRENDVASHVEKKPFRRDVGAGEASGLGRLVDQEPVGLAVLVEERGRAESRRARADDEDADLFIIYLRRVRAYLVNTARNVALYTKCRRGCLQKTNAFFSEEKSIDNSHFRSASGNLPNNAPFSADLRIMHHACS